MTLDRLRRWLHIGEVDGSGDEIARVETEVCAHRESAAALRRTVRLRPEDVEEPDRRPLLDDPLLPRWGERARGAK